MVIFKKISIEGVKAFIGRIVSVTGETRDIISSTYQQSTQNFCMSQTTVKSKSEPISQDEVEDIKLKCQISNSVWVGKLAARQNFIIMKTLLLLKLIIIKTLLSKMHTFENKRLHQIPGIFLLNVVTNEELEPELDRKM